VEPERFPRADAFHLIPQGQDFLLCVAQHRANKNVVLAIGIFERLIRQRAIPCNSQLVVVGIPGPETRNIRDRIRRLKLEANVLLMNGLSDAALQWCYRHCRLLLAPSITEGFGLPVAEALLAGCPVVCSDIPAFREVGGAMCHYVSGGDELVQRYTETIRRVLALSRPDPIAMPQLSSRIAGQKYVELYQTLTCCTVPDSAMLRQPERGQALPVFK
jgi:glycosyltransferase involved in cell wall biosynthesis